MAVAIVTDTCHYLPRELLDANRIHEVSLYVHSHDGTRRESEILDYAAYYQQLRAANALPTTSQPSIGDFLEAYDRLLRDGDGNGNEIVSIHLAGGMSGTVRSAEQAREQLGDRARRVHIVDSATACGGEGLVVLAAAAAARDDADAQTVAARAREARRGLKMWFALDTLEYLRKGGRIGGARAWLGSALRIKPILTVDSEITPVERVRTSRRAFERMLELLQTCRQAGADGWMVQHIQAPEQAAELASRGAEVMRCPAVAVSEIGPVIGTHVGPGLLGTGGLPSRFL